jgi:hypothetical protein
LVLISGVITGVLNGYTFYFCLSYIALKCAERGT